MDTQKLTSEQAAELEKRIQINNATTTVLIRNETLNMFVSILNSFLEVKQKTETKLTDEELQAIQKAVNLENQKTTDLFSKIEEALKEENKN